MAATIVPTITGLPTSGSSGWTKLAGSSMVGSAGLLGDTDSASIGGLTWRVDGTGATFTQDAGGVNVARLASSKTVFAFPLLDGFPDYTETSPEIAVAFRVKTTNFSGNTGQFTGCWFRDDAGVPKGMVHAGPYMQGSSNLSNTVRRERNTGAYDTEYLEGLTSTVPAYIRFVAFFRPGCGVRLRYSHDATALALPAAGAELDTFGTPYGGMGRKPDHGTYDRAGLQTYLVSATNDFTLEEFALYQAP